MCRGCTLTPTDAQTLESLECYGCLRLVALPDLPRCRVVKISGCVNLATLPAELPACEDFVYGAGGKVSTLPELPQAREVKCSNVVLTSLPPLPNLATRALRMRRALSHRMFPSDLATRAASLPQNSLQQDSPKRVTRASRVSRT